MITRPGCRKEPGYVIASYATANHHALFPLHRNSVSGVIRETVGGGGFVLRLDAVKKGIMFLACDLFTVLTELPLNISNNSLIPNKLSDS